MKISFQNLLKVTIPVYQRIRYSYWALRLSSIGKEAKATSKESRSISVAITHYHKSKVIHYSFFNFLKDPRVSEIIILDDRSASEELDKLIAKLEPFRKKIKLYKKEENWGPFGTKIQAVSLCKEDWVLLVDGDNLFPKAAVTRLFNLDWAENTIYCPKHSFPHFDYSNIQTKHPEITYENVLECYEEHHDFGAFINSGNYFLHKNSFVHITQPYFNKNVSAADVLFSNYLWLKGGNRMEIISGFNYFHLVDDTSTFLKTRSESAATAQMVIKLFQEDLMANNKVHELIDNKQITWSEPVLV